MRISAFVAFIICVCGQTTVFALDFKPVLRPDAERDAWSAMIIIALVVGFIAGIRDAFNKQ